ncbi:MAG: alpha/beta hydrolase [Firmicutes bacterium]|nr:alpha/beta hydrolase [Bacillota bacterium]
MEKKYIDIGLENLAYLDEGTGEAIIFLHGNMSSSVHFAPLIERLKGEYRCIAPDLRGFGDSTYNNRFDSLDELAEDTSLFMDKLGIESAYVVGWSTGGGIGLKLAAMYPEKVKKLFCIEGTSHRGYPIFKKDVAFQSTGEPYASKEEMAMDMVQVAPMLPVFANKDALTMANIWKASIYLVNEPTPEESTLWISETLKQRNLIDVDWSLAVLNMSDVPSPYAPGDGSIKDIKCPVAFTSGDKDIVVPRAMVEDNANALGDLATLILYENCAHSPLVDCLDLLSSDISSFLN